jgi:hypothetical protein
MLLVNRPCDFFTAAGRMDSGAVLALFDAGAGSCTIAGGAAFAAGPTLAGAGELFAFTTGAAGGLSFVFHVILHFL